MRLAVCCAMNQNRSMQVHDMFMKRGIEAMSFGTNSVVKLPGECVDRPNVYTFCQSYKEIYEDLCAKNERYYRESGLLHLLERNMLIKNKPENFFQQSNVFDLIITCDEKVFSTIFEYYFGLKCTSDRRFFMVNFDIKDTSSDAVVGAGEVLEFVEMVFENLKVGLEEAFKTSLEMYFEKKGIMLLFTVINL